MTAYTALREMKRLVDEMDLALKELVRTKRAYDNKHRIRTQEGTDGY